MSVSRLTRLKLPVMLIKSHQFVRACFVIVFLLFIAASTSNTATMATLNCRDANAYRLVVVANPNRKKDTDPVIPRDLNIVVGDQIVSKIELPKESETRNFSLNSVEKTKVGFEIKVDWGGGLHHYEIHFNFRCKENNFYLYRVKKITFSTTNPDSGNFLDKKESKVITIAPNLPIEKFVMTDYL